MLNTELVERDPQLFYQAGQNRQSLLQLAPNEVPEEKVAGLGIPHFTSRTYKKCQFTCFCKIQQQQINWNHKINLNKVSFFNRVWTKCHWIPVFYVRSFFNNCITHVSGFAKHQNVRIWCAGNSKKESTTWILLLRSYSLVCCAREWCRRPTSLKKWKSQSSLSFSNAAHLRPIRSLKVRTEGFYSAKWSSFSHYVGHPLSPGWNVCRFVDGKIWSPDCPARSLCWIPLENSLWRL